MTMNDFRNRPIATETAGPAPEKNLSWQAENPGLSSISPALQRIAEDQGFHKRCHPPGRVTRKS